jgi:serine/threonine-protein kinase
MGLVVEAQHLVLAARVAIKFLAPELAQNSEAAARFLREARTTFGIRSSHIVSVLDVGHTETGLPFIVMEYLDGEDVSARLLRLGTMSEQEAVEIVQQAAVGVAYAHSLGIIHRDLKPSNLLCTESSGGLVVKVVDFGISKLTDDSPLGKDSLINTQTATVLGSPLYMAPEQLQSAKHLDEGCDIWALGVILYELLAGRPPFLGKSITEVAINVATQPVPPLGELRPGTSPGVHAVVARCLQKGRPERYLTVNQLIAALRDCALPASSQGADVGGGVGATGSVAARRDQTSREHGSPLTPHIPTLTLDAASSPGSSTGSPVSNTQSPGAFAKGKWTRLGVGTAALALTALTVTWAAHRFATQVEADVTGDGAPVAGGIPETGTVTAPVREVEPDRAPPPLVEPRTVTPAPATASAPAARPASVPLPVTPERDVAPMTAPNTPLAPKVAAPVPTPAPSSNTAAAAKVPCVPYQIRNGVRVFNDDCILQREAQKGRVLPPLEPSKTRKP